MTLKKDYTVANDLVEILYKNVYKALDPEVAADPQTAELVSRAIDERLRARFRPEDGKTIPTGDAGLADLIGLGKDAPAGLGEINVSPGVIDYDEKVDTTRIQAAADLYYLYMHERLGVFRVVNKLQELFKAGTLRISDDAGATALYRYEKHCILRYRPEDRMRAYSRVLGYIKNGPGLGVQPNTAFHGLFLHFIQEVARYWRDKRISEVVRERANDPTFGSMAIVRRAGLDLRNNLKNTSYGNVSVMVMETLQALAEAFRVLQAPDIRAQFGAESAWDLIELVLWQYYQQTVNASAMNRMATSGRKILKWVGVPYLLRTDRREFEMVLLQIADDAEEWLSSAEGMRMSRPTPPSRPVFATRPPGQGRPLPQVTGGPSFTMG